MADNKPDKEISVSPNAFSEQHLEDISIRLKKEPNNNLNLQEITEKMQMKAQT